MFSSSFLHIFSVFYKQKITFFILAASSPPAGCWPPYESLFWSPHNSYFTVGLPLIQTQMLYCGDSILITCPTYSSYPCRVDSRSSIHRIRLREALTMSNRIEKAFISILMELPFYFTLSVKERHLLLSRLTEYYQTLVTEFENEKDSYNSSLKPNYW